MSWVDIAIGGGGAATILSVVGTVAARQVKHAVTRIAGDMIGAALEALRKDVLDDVKSDVGEVKLKLAKETGGNSNGLRQKLDEVAKDVAYLKGALGVVAK